MPVDINGNGTLSGIDLTSSNLGKILQIVRATDNVNRSTTSTTYVDVTGMSVTITPQKSDSTVMILAFFAGQSTRTTNQSVSSLFALTDSSNNFMSGAEGLRILTVDTNSTSTNAIAVGIVLLGYATPATTSAVTYKLRFKSENPDTTTETRDGVITGQMFAIEVAA